MEKMCMISNSSQLENISTEIYNLIDQEVDIHVVLQGHKCGSAISNSEILFQNHHPSHRVIFVTHDMIHEFRCMNYAIASYYGGQPLKFSCPACYEGLTGM